MHIKKNIFSECQKLDLGFWQCPIVLFSISMLFVLGLISFMAFNFVISLKVSFFIIFFTFVFFTFLGYMNFVSFNRILKARQMEAELKFIASHQLKTPITEIKWTLETIDRKIKNNKKEEIFSKEYFDNLKNATTQMQSVMDIFLELGRLETGRINLNKTSFSINELTSKEIKKFDKKIKSKKQKINFKPNDSLPEVKTDKKYLLAVMENLINNAIYYSGKNKTIKIEVKKEDENYIKWSIKDQGVGIPRNQQKNIFEKYFRIEDNNQMNQNGSGLGLYISKKIIEVLGGEIDFVSEENKGSVFWFKIPINH